MLSESAAKAPSEELLASRASSDVGRAFCSCRAVEAEDCVFEDIRRFDCDVEEVGPAGCVECWVLRSMEGRLVVGADVACRKQASAPFPFEYLSDWMVTFDDSVRHPFCLRSY